MAAPTIEATGRRLVLTGERTAVSDLLRDLGRRRTLLPMLAARDFRARYRSSTLGLAWAVLLPLLQGAVLAVVFTHFVRVRTAAHYPVFVLVGMTTWTYMTVVVQTATTSIVDQADIAGRVYFPRLFLPGMSALAGVPGLFAGLIIIIPLAAGFGSDPTWHLIGIPVVCVLAFMLTYSAGAVLALANVYFRDVRYFIVAMLQALMYLCPIIYPLSLIHRHADLLALNPATGVIEFARWTFAVNGTDAVLLPMIATLSWIAVLIAVALLAFSRHERRACDRL